MPSRKSAKVALTHAVGPSKFAVGADFGDLLVGKDGWCAWRLESSDVRIRLEDVQGVGLRITAVALVSSKLDLFGTMPVLAKDLRSIPLVQLEAMVNNPLHRESLTEALSDPVAKVWDFSPGAELPNLASRRTRVTQDSDYRIEGVGARGKRPDAFYEAVAAMWAKAIANGHVRPAGVIAEANDVAVTAVHRWVREARRREVMARSPRSAKVEALPSTVDRST